MDKKILVLVVLVGIVVGSTGFLLYQKFGTGFLTRQASGGSCQ